MFSSGWKWQRALKMAPFLPFYPVYRQRTSEKTQIKKKRKKHELIQMKMVLAF